MLTVIAMIIVAGSSVGASPPLPEPQSEVCAIIRISPQGRRSVIDQEHEDYARYRQRSVRVENGQAGAYASASSSGSSSSSSSVSVSSSSRNGRSTASATARDDAGARTVTTTRDHNGCTTVFDERPAQRSDR